MKRLRTKGAIFPTLLLLLLLLWTWCSLASSTRGIGSDEPKTGKDVGCEVFTDKISDTEFVLDTQTLQSANGNVQRILDCMPEGSKVLIDMENVPMNEDLVLWKPLAIHSKRSDERMTILGGFIRVTANNSTIKGLKIKDCSLSSTEGFIDVDSAEGVVIEEVECSNCSNSDGPSCISAARSSVTIRKFSGKNNRGVNGGAVRFTDSTIVIRDSLFEDNTSSDGGGAFYMDTCDFEMENTVFSRNSADGRGGGIYAKGGSRTGKPALVQKCSFIGNHAYGLGGGLFYSIDRTNNPIFKVQSSRFIGNFAGGGGGGMYILPVYSNTCSIEVESCDISHNSSGGNGGGFYVLMYDFTNGILQIINSKIVSNSASLGGGVHFNGHYSDNCTTDVIGTQITNNTARAGGGVYLYYEDATNGHNSIYKSSINDNTAPKGAGMYFEAPGSNAIDLKLLLSSITKNSNGGLYFDIDSATDFEETVFECIITENSGQASADLFVNRRPTQNQEISYEKNKQRGSEI